MIKTLDEYLDERPLQLAGSAPRIYTRNDPHDELLVHTPHEPGVTRINVVTDLGFPPGSVFSIPPRKRDEPFEKWLRRVQVVKVST